MTGGIILTEMEAGELIFQYSICGIWIEPFRPLSSEKMVSLINKIPRIRYIAYCLTDETSALLGECLERFQGDFPLYRIVTFGNYDWYQSFPGHIQNRILQRIDQSDIFVQCIFPLEDALKYLVLYSKHLFLHCPQRKRESIIKTVGPWNAKRIIKI